MSLSPADARAFRERWRLANAAQRRELRQTSLDRRFRQLAALMASADLFGRADVVAAEDAAVRRRWARIRRAFHAGR